MKPETAHRLAHSYAIFILAWVLFELAAQVFPAIGIPNWAVRLLVVIILVGCPVGVLWTFSLPADTRGRATVKASSVWAVSALAILLAVGAALVAMQSIVGMLAFIVLFLPGALAAFGLWYGRRWGWWLQLFSSLIYLLLFPVGTIIAGVGIAFLLWIRPAYFRLSPPPVPGAVLRAILLRILLLLCIGITLLVGLAFVFSGLEARKASLRLSSALHGAREVTFVEFQRGFSSHEVVFQRVPAKPADIARLKAATSPWSAFVPPWAANCFTPHHRIEITRADGTQTHLEICFLCHNFAFDEEDETSLPPAWERSLRGFFASVGMPGRTLSRVWRGERHTCGFERDPNGARRVQSGKRRLSYYRPGNPRSSVQASVISRSQSLDATVS